MYGNKTNKFKSANICGFNDYYIFNSNIKKKE